MACAFCGGDASRPCLFCMPAEAARVFEPVEARGLAPLAPVSVEKFAQYHADNPHVYAILERFALEAYAAGRPRIGIGLLTERVRWYTTVETTGDPFKINNNWRAFYVRLLLRDHPELADLFELRTSKADEGRVRRVYAAEVRIVPKSHPSKHQNGDRGRQADAPSGGDCALEGGQSHTQGQAVD